MPDPAGEFDALAEEFYGVWFRYHPQSALAVGVPGFGTLLPARDQDDLAALTRWLETLLLGLAEIEPDELDADRRLDYELMSGAARMEHSDLTLFDRFSLDPLGPLPVAEIHQLTLGPLDGLCDQLAELLAGVPEHLRRAQARLDGVAAWLPQPLVRTAILESDGGRCYLRELVRGPWLRRHCPGLGELETIAEGVCDALADYREFLRDALLPRATGQSGCGATYLGVRLEEIHFIPWEQANCRESLVEALAEVDAALADEALGGQVGGAPQVVVPSAQRETTHLQLVDDLAQEIAALDLVSLPAAPLGLRVRPACPGSQRFHAAYRPDPEGGGILYLPAQTSGTDETLELVRARALAQVWGGCHLLAQADPQRARRMPRRLANGMSLAQGWNLYLERRLAAGGDPARRRFALERRRHLLTLALIDLDLHTDLVDDRQALARLEVLGLSDQTADAELTALALNPGDALAGALGWLLLEAAMVLLERDQGEAFSARAFHDRLVSQGAVPVGPALRSAVGEELWRRAYAMVFGDR